MITQFATPEILILFRFSVSAPIDRGAGGINWSALFDGLLPFGSYWQIIAVLRPRFIQHFGGFEREQQNICVLSTNDAEIFWSKPSRRCVNVFAVAEKEWNRNRTIFAFPLQASTFCALEMSMHDVDSSQFFLLQYTITKVFTVTRDKKENTRSLDANRLQTDAECAGLLERASVISFEPRKSSPSARTRTSLACVRINVPHASGYVDGDH